MERRVDQVRNDMVKERCDVEMAKSASKKLGLLFKC